MTQPYAGNPPFSATDESVRALFAQHGAVKDVSLVTAREANRPRGFGFVEMANAEALRATQPLLYGTDFGGRTIAVNKAEHGERIRQRLAATAVEAPRPVMWLRLLSTPEERNGTLGGFWGKLGLA